MFDAEQLHDMSLRTKITVLLNILIALAYCLYNIFVENVTGSSILFQGTIVIMALITVIGADTDSTDECGTELPLAIFLFGIFSIILVASLLSHYVS